MPALPTLVIEASDGTTKASADCITAAANRNLVEMWNATATLDRSEWLAAASNLNEVNDRLRIERGDGTTLFEGRFANDVQDGNTVTVTINAYEQDAIDAEPTQGRVIYENVADSTIASDGIDAVPTLTKGTIETGASAISFTFANANQSKRIRDAAEPAGQDLRYNPDRSVDFLNRLGADKSSITISSANQNIVDELSVEENSRDPVTHIRGLGAQQGGKQVRATATVPSYSSGRKVWREYENTDIMQVDRMQAIVDRLADGFDNEQRRLLVTAILLDVDVSIGDRITVDLPQHNIDRLLRITQLTESLTSAGKRYNVTLTNRDVERGGARKRRDDLQRFNRGDQGFVDRAQAGGGSRQPVNGSLNSVASVVYPDDVVREDVARVFVEGLPYRAYSSGGGNNPSFSNVATYESGSNIATVSNLSNWQTVFSWDPSPGVKSQAVEYYIDIRQAAANVTGPLELSFRLAFDFGDEGYWPIAEPNLGQLPVGSDVPDEESSRTVAASVPGDLGGLAQVELQVALNTYGTVDSTWEFDIIAEIVAAYEGVHTHPADPGIIEDFSDTTYYPSNCDVLVNGTSQGVSLGDGTSTFEDFVDIAGELTPGVNTVEVTSDTLGHIRSTVETELFRSGGPAP